MPTSAPLNTVQNTPSMTVDACSKMVEAATKSCSTMQDSPPPNWDAMASSFGSLSAAFAWGSIVLAIVALIGAVAWGYLVKGWAEKEARKEAKECADDLIAKWLSGEAPKIVRQHVEFLQNTAVGKGDDDKAADEMGAAAG